MSNLLRRLTVLRYRPPFVLLHFSVATFLWSLFLSVVVGIASFDYPEGFNLFISLTSVTLFSILTFFTERNIILSFKPNKKANLKYKYYSLSIMTILVFLGLVVSFWNSRYSSVFFLSCTILGITKSLVKL